MCLCRYVFVVGMCASALYSTLNALSEATGLTYHDLNSGTGYMVPPAKATTPYQALTLPSTVSPPRLGLCALVGRCCPVREEARVLDNARRNTRE